MMAIISDDAWRRRSPNGIGLLEGDEEQLHARMLADETARAAATTALAAYDDAAPAIAIDARPRRIHCRDPLRSTRAIRRAPAPAGSSAAWVVLLLLAAPVRAAGARPAERRRLHPRRPRVGARQGAPRDASSACHPRRSSSSLEQHRRCGRDAGLRDGRRRRRCATSPSAPHVARRRVAHPRAAPGLGRRPHRLRHRLPRPAARRLAGRAADPARAAPARAAGLTVELAGGPAFYGDVQTVSEADLRRSEIISLPLAALALLLVFGSVVAAGVPLVVGGAAVVVALAAIFVVASRDADEHLRAQPRDAPRPRARAWTTRC